MSMDRRSFIKLTAVTGGATAIAACSTGSPENELIRFVPDEDLTPGIAEMRDRIDSVHAAYASGDAAAAAGVRNAVMNRL